MYRYRSIVALIAGLGVSSVAGAAVNWDFKYEGNVLPLSAGSISFPQTAQTDAFYGSIADVSTDGSVLSIGASAGTSDGYFRTDSNEPYPGTSTMNLKSSVGYTAEWRARLDATAAPPYAYYAPYAGIQLSNGVTEGYNVTAFAGIGDSDTNPSNGYLVQMISHTASSPAAVPVSAGFHTFRLTVLGTTSSLYIDGNPIAAVSITEALGGANGEVRFGNFSSPDTQAWSLDYLYITDDGAFAPELIPEPASLGLLALGGLTLLRRRK